MMNLLVVLSSFLLTTAAILALRPMAVHFGLMDIPGGRKTHRRPTPMTGGLAIYIGLLCVSLLTPVVLEQFQALLVIGAFILVVGTLDDIREMRASLRLAFQSVAAWMMISMAGLQITTLGDLWFSGPIQLGLLAVPFTIFITVGVINAVNMSDGLDGLSGGLVAIALLFLCAAAAAAGQTEMLTFNQILVMAVLAFLVMNFRLLARKSARVYLGDAGSTLLGFILAWVLIASSQGGGAFIAPVEALYFVAIPLMDTVALMVKRPLRGHSPFRPGRDHLHHCLLAKGFNNHQTVLIIYAAAIVLGAIGLIGHFLDIHDSLMFLLFVALFLAYFIIVPGKETKTTASAM